MIPKYLEEMRKVVTRAGAGNLGFHPRAQAKLFQNKVVIYTNIDIGFGQKRLLWLERVG